MEAHRTGHRKGQRSVTTPEIGFEVRAAESARKAVVLWSSGELHLIFMVVQMAAIDGYEATQKIGSTLKGLSKAIAASTARL